MKILYSLPHPSDRLGMGQAGHIIRATAITKTLQELDIDVYREEAASANSARTSVGLYRNIIRKLLPRRFAMIIRDLARIDHGRKYAQRLITTINIWKPDVILETHIAFSRAGKIASEATGIPVVIDDCAPIWEEEQQYGVGLKTFAENIHREVISNAKLLVAVNDTLRRFLVEEGVSEDKVVTVENGIDEKIFYPRVNAGNIRLQHGIYDDAIVVGFVGSFQPYHRVDLLLKAYKNIVSERKVHLLLVGDGRGYEDSITLARQLGLDNSVSFVGRVSYEEVPNYIAAADISIMPATNNYGNPMKIYEYLAMGKPIIAPDQPTITDILTHNENAYLFKPEDVAALTNALEVLISNSKLREKFGRMGIKRSAEYTWKSRVSKLVTAVQQILNV